VKIFDIAGQIKNRVDEFKPIVPVALGLRRDGMKERHWQALTDKTGIAINPETEENFTLQSVVDRGMVKFVTDCDDIGEKANKEFNIEKSLAKMKKEWQGQIFLTPEFKNTRTYIIAGFDEAAALLDEHIVTG
jgi:dynein heavy chain